MSTPEGTTNTVYHGRVKWFNNKAGYGFITVIEGPVVNDKVGTDIFAHHTSICVSEEQYKYLVQGEYVEFSISTIETTTEHKYQSSNIKGMNSGKLLCETRNENRANMSHRNSRPPRTQESGSRYRGTPRPDSRVGNNNNNHNQEWGQVNQPNQSQQM